MRARSWLALSIAGIAALVVLAALALAWLVATPGGARLVLDRVSSALGEGAQLSGVEGSLWGTLRVKAIDLKRPDLEIRVEDVEIQRAPGSLWGRAEFAKVVASRVTVRTGSTGAAARMPVALKAPYPLRVDEVRVGEIRLGTLAKEGTPARGEIVLKEVFARGEGDERAWKIDKASARTEWGVVTLAGTIGTSAPFALDLRGDLSGERGELRYKVDARVGGTLKTVEAAFQGTERDLQVTGTAILEPFEGVPLRTVTLRTTDLDLRRFGALPHTRLAIEAQLVPIANGFGGPVSIVNAAPGAIDRDRIPVSAVRGRTAWTREANAARLDIRDAHFALAGGGQASGSLAWRAGRLEAVWQVAGLDLAHVHTQLKPTRLSGSVKAVSEADANRFDVALTDPRFGVEGRALLRAGRLDVETVTLRQARAVVEGKGFVVTGGRREFRFEGRARHFDPSAFANVAAGDLNFDFVAAGALAPSVSGDFRAEIHASRIAGMPASGRLRVAGDAQRLGLADVSVVVGEARVEAKGAFGGPGDALAFAVQAPDLAAIGKPFGVAVAGKLDARGTLTGTFAAPGGEATFDAANLALPSGLHIAAARGRANVATAADGKVDAALEARTITRRSRDSVRTIAQRATLAIEGTRARHRANVAATLTKQDELRATLDGGLDPRARRLAWRGTLSAFELGGPSALALTAPAPLVLAADRIELGEATLKGSWGEARLEVTRWTPALVELRGSTPGIGVRNAARALRLPEVPRGNLSVAARWDLRAAQTVDGSLTVSRTAGDLRIGEPPQPLGLEVLNLRIDASRGQAKGVLAMRGIRIGRVDAEVEGTLQHVSAGLGIVRDAPIRGRVSARMESIAWMAAWMGPEARADGSVSTELALSGTFAEPRWNGQLSAERIHVRDPASGFEVENGVATLRLRDRSLVVESLSASAPWNPGEAAARALKGVARPAAGTLSASGAIDLGARTGAITIKAVAVPVTQVPARFVALSGEARLEARADGVLASGTLRADAGWIGALATPLPSVSDDVVVVRATAPADERRVRERLRMDMRFNLGENLWYQGRGLNTRLAGELRVVGEPGAGLRATGSIRTVDGTYDAYGQKLSIEHGTLTFFGSLENPALNVLALRKGLPVEAGVEVRGNVSKPRVRLVSLPEVPDPEKISWLVLGRGPSDVSQGEAATLVATATALLGRGAGSDRIVQRFGFDEVRIGRSDTMSALGTLPQSTVAGKTGSASAAEVVTVGKRLSKDVYVVYEQGLADAEGALRIAWQISRHFQLLLRAGYLPGVDAVYRWTFE